MDLIQRCLRREEGAWSEFLSQFEKVARRAAAATLARVLGSSPEDDVQAVVEQLWIALVKDDHAALRRFTGRSSLAGYLRAITAKIALNHIRSEKRKGWLRFKPVDPEIEAPEPEEADPIHLKRLNLAMEKLPTRDRLILKMFHFDGASYRDISAVLGLPANAVSPTLIRARQKLKVLLAGER